MSTLRTSRPPRGRFGTALAAAAAAMAATAFAVLPLMSSAQELADEATTVGSTSVGVEIAHRGDCLVSPNNYIGCWRASDNRMSVYDGLEDGDYAGVRYRINGGELKSCRSFGTAGEWTTCAIPVSPGQTIVWRACKRPAEWTPVEDWVCTRAVATATT